MATKYEIMKTFEDCENIYFLIQTILNHRREASRYDEQTYHMMSMLSGEEE